MSTAVVSGANPFDFVRDIFNKMPASPKVTFAMDSKAVGTPLAPTPLSRRNSNPVTSSSVDTRICFGKIVEHPVLTVSRSTGNDDSVGHRKLDRSHSEPVERSSNSQRQPNANSSRYKTELCRPFEENGTCKYGDKCQFAHGANEMRALVRHPKYKTELCRTYHTIGFCPYGPRCHFVHNAEEARNKANQNRAQVARKTPKPLTMSLGSTSESPSPPSSLSGSPTSSLSSFFCEDIFAVNPFSPTPSPLTPNGNHPFAFNADLPSLGRPSNSFPRLSQQQLLREQQQMREQQQYNLTLSQQNMAMNSDLERSYVHSDVQGSSPIMNIPGLEAAPSPVDSLGSDLDNLSVSESPPDVSSPLEISRSLRLPVFSNIRA